MGLPGQGPTTRFPLSLLLQVVSQEDLPLPKGATEAGRHQGRAEDVPLPRGWSTGQRGAGSSGWSRNQHACTKLTGDRRADTGAAPSVSGFLQPRAHARENCTYPAAPGSLRRGRKGRKQRW